MAIAGIVSSHGTCPNTPTSKGLVHNKTSVAATISCIQFNPHYFTFSQSQKNLNCTHITSHLLTQKDLNSSSKSVCALKKRKIPCPLPDLKMPRMKISTSSAGQNDNS